MANLAGLYHRYPEWSGQWFGTNPLAGQFPRKTSGLVARGDEGRARRASRWRWPTARARCGFQAIVGLSEAGQTPPAPLLRAALTKEPDAVNQAVLAEALGTLKRPTGGADLDRDLPMPAGPSRSAAAALAALSPIARSAVAACPVHLALRPQGPAGLVARALARPGPLGFLARQRSGARFWNIPPPRFGPPHS